MSLTRLHAVSGGLALATISGFFLATVVSELWGTRQDVALVKTWILYLIPLLVVFMASAGAMGGKVAKGWDLSLVRRKKVRMAAIAGNGILVLIPCAYLLYRWANQESFGSGFYLVQTIELIAGATNITLLSLNLKTGLGLRNTGRSA